MQGHIRKAHPTERIWRCDCDRQDKYISMVVHMCYQVLVDGKFVCSSIPEKEIQADNDDEDDAVPEKSGPTVQPTPEQFRVVIAKPRKKKRKKGASRDRDPSPGRDPKKKKKVVEEQGEVPDFSWLQDSVEGNLAKKE